MKTEDLTKDQKSLLLYLETCLVDHAGKIEPYRMNEVDWENMVFFKSLGLIDWERLTAKYVTSTRGCAYRPTHWVSFECEDAWVLAHQLRRERAERLRESEIGKKGKR